MMHLSIYLLASLPVTFFCMVLQQTCHAFFDTLATLPFIDKFSRVFKLGLEMLHSSRACLESMHCSQCASNLMTYSVMFRTASHALNQPYAEQHVTPAQP